MCVCVCVFFYSKVKKSLKESVLVARCGIHKCANPLKTLLTFISAFFPPEPQWSDYFGGGCANALLLIVSVDRSTSPCPATRLIPGGGPSLRRRRVRRRKNVSRNRLFLQSTDRPMGCRGRPGDSGWDLASGSPAPRRPDSVVCRVLLS